MVKAADDQVSYSGDGIPERDELERDPYIEAVTNLVLNVDPPFTVGILGDWGAGKTTFMDLVRKALEEPGIEKKCRTVQFNLWEHEHDDDPVVAMLHEARRQLAEYLDEADKADKSDDSPTPGGELTRKNKIQLLLLAIGSTTVLGGMAVATTVGVPWLIPLLLKVGPAGWEWVRTHVPQVWNLAKDIVDMGKKSTDIVKTLVNMSKGKKDKAKKLASELAEAHFETIDREVELKAQFNEVLELLAGAPEAGTGGEGGEKKDGNKQIVVFFIDDLDRCTPATTVALLERIKLYLYNDLCVFVIGLDDTATQKAVARVHKFDAYDPARANSPARSDEDSSSSADADSSGGENDAQRYLEKIIQFPFRIPPVRKEKHREYIANILKANRLSDLVEEGEAKNGSVISIFDASLIEVNASLRQVKRLVNLFTFNHVLAKPQFTDTRIGYDPAVMAAVTALQVLHETAYRDLCSGPNRDRRGQMLVELCCGDIVGEGLWSSAKYGKLQQFREQIQQIGTFTKEELDRNLEAIQTYYDQYIQWAAASAPALPEEKVPASPTYQLFPIPRETLERYRAKDGQGQDMDPGEWIKQNWPQAQPWWSEAPLRLSAGGFVWRVMKVDNENNPTSALLLSEYVIAQGPYHGISESVTWQKSDIRDWLNGEFFRGLGPDLRKRVLETAVVPERNPSYPEVPQGSKTEGRVFLLSIQEVADGESTDTAESITERLIGRRTGLIATPPSQEGGVVWWLRSSGVDLRDAAVVRNGGIVYGWYYNVDNHNVGVRPALWINL